MWSAKECTSRPCVEQAALNDVLTMVSGATDSVLSCIEIITDASAKCLNSNSLHLTKGVTHWTQYTLEDPALGYIQHTKAGEVDSCKTKLTSALVNDSSVVSLKSTEVERCVLQQLKDIVAQHQLDINGKIEGIVQNEEKTNLNLEIQLLKLQTNIDELKKKTESRKSTNAVTSESRKTIDASTSESRNCIDTGFSASRKTTDAGTYESRQSIDAVTSESRNSMDTVFLVSRKSTDAGTSESRKSTDAGTSKTLQHLAEQPEALVKDCHGVIRTLDFRSDVQFPCMQTKRDMVADFGQVVNKETSDVNRKIEGFELKMGLLCKIVGQRLLPVEKLMKTLNEQIVHKHRNKKEVHPLQVEISKEFLDFNDHQKPPCIGFTAYFDRGQALSIDSILSGFGDVKWNSGHFNPRFGVFNAPVDGMYFACFTIGHSGTGSSEAGSSGSGSSNSALVHKSGLNRTLVGHVVTKHPETFTSCTALVRMKTNDKLFIQLLWVEQKPEISGYTNFSCFLLSMQ